MAKRRDLPHLLLSQRPSVLGYTPKRGRKELNLTTRPDHQVHGRRILSELEAAVRNIQAAKANRPQYRADLRGVYLQFESDVNRDLLQESLEMLNSEVRLSRVYEVVGPAGKKRYAVLFIPNDQRSKFLNKLTDYLSEVTKSGIPKNKPLIESIESIKAAAHDSFWADDLSLLPNAGVKVWCEVWIRLSDRYEEMREQSFRHFCQRHSIELDPFWIRFEERSIFLAKIDSEDIDSLIVEFEFLAEVRLAKEVASFWTRLTPADQTSSSQELLARMEVNENSNVAICILDTGVNPEHPLLRSLIGQDATHAVRSEWGPDDSDGHGTNMAGVAAFGDLVPILTSNAPHAQGHLIESVKILRHRGFVPAEVEGQSAERKYELWGAFVEQAVARIESSYPNRFRIFSMAVSATDIRDRGRPTSWSATIDKLAFGFDYINNKKDKSRLFLIAAGNLDESMPEAVRYGSYPDACLTDLIHDPAQAYNALTVGAYTEKIIIEDLKSFSNRDYRPVAPNGGISPFTTASVNWDHSKWPIKPDIVMEGGNVAQNTINQNLFVAHESLGILTTSAEFTTGQFDLVFGTSPAVAAAANIAAKIATIYPAFTAETIRGLMVHCAEWTDTMKSQLSPMEKKAQIGRALRVVGYGVPSLERCLHSANNSLTMIVQRKIQPFWLDGGSAKTKDIQYYELPWPKEALLAAGSTPVRLRITLSYFAEPYPGEMGYKDRYRYCSHGLRFDLISAPHENTIEEFNRRINAQAEAEENQESEEAGSQSFSDRWYLGQNNIRRGTVQSDWLVDTTAADLAVSNILCVYPVIGWWRELKKLRKMNSEVDYSLIVSLETEDQAIDIYTPVAQKITNVPPIAPEI